MPGVKHKTVGDSLEKGEFEADDLHEGYILSVQDTATITAGNTSVIVTHGKGSTPGHVSLTPLDDLGARNYWVSDIGATQFTIHISMVDPWGDHQFKWAA